MEVPTAYLIIHNVAKTNNVGTLIRSGAAFAVAELWVVGRRELQTFGNQGTVKKMPLRQFTSLVEMKEHACARQVQVCGVEIVPEARSVWDSPFTGSTAFLMGNEGSGLSAAEREVCDWFVYIPQYESNTESLNVSVAGSIILHHFAHWACRTESLREGEKFAKRHQSKAEAAADWPQDLIEAKRAERARKREEADLA